MNVVLDPQPNCIVNLQVELPADQVTREWRSVAKEFQRQARIPGYRPGKAPQALIDSRFAKSIREELQSKLLRESLNEAIKLKNLHVLSVAKVDGLEIAKDNTMRYVASVVTAPEFELPDYSSLTIEIARREVTDADVEKWLEQARESQATFEAIEGRPVAMGDYAVLSYEGKIGEQLLSEAFPGTPAQLQGRRNAWVFMDEGTLIPGFTKAIEGMSAGEERSFTLHVPETFPLAELRNSQISYTATLHGINIKILPPMDDALAEKIEAGKSLEEVRSALRERLMKIAESEFENGKRNAAVKQLLAKVECELPTHAVNRELSNILRDVVQENRGRGVSDDELMAHENEIVGVAQQSARDRVRANFLLLRIAEKEKLEVSETDMLVTLSEMSRRYEIPIKKLIKELQSRGGFDAIREQILMGKALDLIASNVTIVEPPVESSHAEASL